MIQVPTVWRQNNGGVLSHRKTWGARLLDPKWDSTHFDLEEGGVPNVIDIDDLSRNARATVMGFPRQAQILGPDGQCDLAPLLTVLRHRAGKFSERRLGLPRTHDLAGDKIHLADKFGNEAI